MQIDQPLLNNVQIQVQEDEEDRAYIRTSEIYDKAVDQYKQAQSILLVYSGLKLLVSLILVTLHNSLSYCSVQSTYKRYDEVITPWGQDYIAPWMYLIVIHSFGAIIYYWSIVKFVQQEEQNLEVCEQLGYSIYIEVPGDIQIESEVNAYIQEQTDIQNNVIMERLEVEGAVDENRRVSLLAMEIKRKVQSLSLVGKYIGKSCFILFQVLEIWGLVYYFSNYAVSVYGCDEMYVKFLFVILFFGMYQYLDLYIMFILIVLFLPMFLCYSLYEWIKDYFRKRKERIRINNILTSVPYQEDPTNESNECVICMQQYSVGDDIIILPCSDKHRFHSQCIKNWFNVNALCPLCRNSIMEPQL